MSSHGPPAGRNRLFAVSPAPFSPDVQYYDTKAISLYATNVSDTPQLLEKVSVQFQSDSGESPVYVDHNHGMQVDLNKATDINIAVRPTAIYRENTNVFGLMIYCRAVRDNRLADALAEELHANCHYLIIRPPSATLGGVFISFKQPENLAHAEALARYARRAGFTPYVVKNDPNPGTDQWQRIENAIKQSCAAFIVWTSRTKWGTGVEKEIELCRKHKVSEILLLEKEQEVPTAYLRTPLEYSVFDRVSPGSCFSDAVSALRTKMLKR
jgi:hypothetical protein